MDMIFCWKAGFIYLFILKIWCIFFETFIHIKNLAGRWCTPLILALRRQRQAVLCEFEASLVYILSSSRTSYLILMRSATQWLQNRDISSMQAVLTLTLFPSADWSGSHTFFALLFTWFCLHSFVHSLGLAFPSVSFILYLLILFYMPGASPVFFETLSNFFPLYIYLKQ